MTGVWSNNVTGDGVVVAVVDDGKQTLSQFVLSSGGVLTVKFVGLDWRHPDLKDNYVSENHVELCCF